MTKQFAKFKPRYKQPTPKKWKKIGNALLIGSLAASSYEVFDGHPFWSGAIALSGVAGKVITSLFIEE